MTLCNRDAIEAIIIDMSGNDDWLAEQRFKDAFLNLGEQYTILYTEGEELDWSETSIVYIDEMGKTPVQIAESLRKIEWEYSEFETLVLTNNATNISKWSALNYSVIYIATSKSVFLEIEHMPDEIWNINKLEQFIEGESVINPFAMELVGVENGVNLTGVKYRRKKENWITNIPYEVICVGRYFKYQDSRHYIHPLSRAIIQFKRIVNDQYGSTGARLAILRIFARVVENYILAAEDVSLVTAVPPRPNQQHRFYGFEEFYQENVLLDFDILTTKYDYESPKNYRIYEEKYSCVENAFEVKRAVHGHIVLLDDVYTTGVTTSECVKILLEAGAERVTVLPIACTQANSAERYMLNGAFDDLGNEYKMLFNRGTGKALWKRDNLDGFVEHKDVVEYYLAQNKACYNLKEVGILPKLDEIEAIIFDLDDTLVETSRLEWGRRQNNKPSKETILLNSNSIIAPYDLQLLKGAGIKIGIVTRSKPLYAQAVLEAYGYPYDCLISRYDCERTKPYGDPFISCSRRLGVQSERILAIGNEVTDTQASISVGMYTIEIGRTHIAEEVHNLLQEIIVQYLPF